MHPSTPIIILCPLRRSASRVSRRLYIFCSALSRTEHVLRNTASASLMSSHDSYPAICITDATTSESATFIWHPYVSINSFFIIIISFIWAAKLQIKNETTKKYFEKHNKQFLYHLLAVYECLCYDYSHLSIKPVVNL